MGSYTANELMVCQAARQLGNAEVVFVGIGLPNLACNLARRLQGGLIDVGFLQGAQIDRFGNLNTTVIGSYEKPSVRLPGSGGACEIAISGQARADHCAAKQAQFPRAS